MDQVIFAGLSLKMMILIIVGIAVVGRVLAFVFRPKVSAKLIKKRCGKCKWEGPAGIHNNACPKCKGPLRAIG